MVTEKSVKDVKPTTSDDGHPYLPLEDTSIYHWNKEEKFKWNVILFVGSMLVYSVRVSMSICAPAIGKELGWNKQISGMALSAFFCGYVLTNVLGGYMADRHGGQIVICYTGVGWALLTLMLPALAHTESPFHTATTAVLMARFLTGVCQGVFFPSITSILTKHVSIAERGFIVAFINSGSAVGTTVTGFFGSIVVENLNWSYVFVTVGSLSVLWILYFKYLMSMNTVCHEYKDKDIKPKEPVPWVKIASRMPFWALLIAYFTSSYCFYNLLSWTPLYFHEAFPESPGWLFNVVPWVVSFTFTNLSGYFANILIADGYSITFIRKLYATILFLGTVVFSLLLNSVETFKQALFIMSLNIGVGAFQNCSILINSQDLAPRHAGALHGFVNSCGACAGFVGVYVTGYILESTGQWSSVFVVTAGSAFIGLISFLLFGSGERII